MNEAVRNTDYSEVKRLVREYYTENRNFKIITKTVFQNVLSGTGTEEEKIRILDFFNDIRLDVPDSGLELSPNLLYLAATYNQCKIALYLMRKGIDYSHNNYRGLMRTRELGNKCFTNIIREFPETIEIFQNYQDITFYRDTYVIRESPLEYTVSGISNYSIREVMINVNDLSRTLVEIYTFITSPEDPEELARFLDLENPDAEVFYDPSEKDYAVYFTCVEKHYLLSLRVLLQYYSSQSLLNRLLAYACYFNYSPTITFLIESGAVMTQEALENSVRGCHVDLVKKILTMGKFNRDVSLRIAEQKKMEGQNYDGIIDSLKFKGKFLSRHF